MQRAADTPELLDGPLDDPTVLRGNLRDLERVNRRLGGVRLSARAISALAGARAEVTILDVGTGGADIPMALLERAQRRGQRWHVTGIDSRPEILAAALTMQPGMAAMPGLRLDQGDGRSLPYPDASFDIVHTSLVVHHLAPDEVVQLLVEMRRVARLGVVVNDLVRTRLGWLGAWLLVHVATRNRFTRHDAPLSVRRAYTTAELTALADAAALRIDLRAFGFAGHRWAFAARAVEAVAIGEIGEIGEIAR
ncbi:MAG: methyltransferase domain-containing protein [Candidatus Limnocylindrales bacterium]